MNESERERRKRTYAVLCDLMLLLSNEDSDYWNAHTYGELLDVCVKALTEEHARIKFHAECEAKVNAVFDSIPGVKREV